MEVDQKELVHKRNFELMNNRTELRDSTGQVSGFVTMCLVPVSPQKTRLY
jgi:hypothetical protein